MTQFQRYRNGRLETDWLALLLSVVVALCVVAFCACLSLILDSCAKPAGYAAPCDDTSLLAMKNECWALVRTNCMRSDAGAVDENCPTLKACDAKLERWYQCHADAGSDSGAP